MSESRQGEQASAVGRDSPLVYEWVGEFVFLSYMDSPSVPNEMYSEGSSPPIIKSALFFLTEVSALGVVVRRVYEKDGEQQLSLSAFLPWSAITSVQGTPKDPDERKEMGLGKDAE